MTYGRIAKYREAFSAVVGAWPGGARDRRFSARSSALQRMTSDLEFPRSNEVFRNQILDQHQVVPLVPELAVLLVDADFFPSRHLAELAAGIVVSHDAPHQFVIAFV